MTEITTPRILVIDDNPDIHADFRKILIPDRSLANEVSRVETVIFGEESAPDHPPQFEIDSAYQGAEGLECVKQACASGRPYALVFVDVRMPPGWDGIETIRELWKADPMLEVVICTAFADYSAREITRQLGRTSSLLILKKPFDNIEVLQMASSLTEKWRLARSLQSHLDNLQSLVKERTLELERSLSMIKATLDATADAILVVDNAGRVVTFNETLLRTWHVEETSLDGAENEAALAPMLSHLENPGAFLTRIRDTRSESNAGQLGRLEFKDGRIFEYYSHPQYLGGEVVGRVWSFRDISQRQRAEEALRSSENHYRQLFEANPTPVYVFDADSLGFITANEAAVLHYGYNREEFSAMNLRDIALPEEVPAFIQRLTGLTASPGNSGVWRHRKKNGQLCEMEITTHPLVLAGRNAWLSLAMNVTERLSLEAQLRQSQKMESIGQLAGGIAHDFNNLLTVINGHAGLLLAKEKLSPQIADPLREISEAAKRAADLTRQLLTFSRKQVIQLQVVDLNEVVNNVGKMLRRIVGEDISMEVEYSPSLPRVKADLGMIEQVLLNLAVNSRDAMPRGGRLRISTSSMMVTTEQALQNPEAVPGRCVCLAFADGGCGIPPENLSRIFEPFFTTKELDRGTGLGLATVYGIVKQHQGWIEVTSEINQGTTFQIFLPATNEPSGAVTMPPGDARVIGGTETILVVEDEIPLLKLIHHILESHGYKVLDCQNGKTALELWEQHRKKIELLLTDMVLPDGMTGPELAEILQTGKPGLKVIYTSGYNTEKLPQTLALREGFNFLQKPFHARKLAETVHDCLNTKPQA